jgi:hypothetical protein
MLFLSGDNVVLKSTNTTIHLTQFEKVLFGKDSVGNYIKGNTVPLQKEQEEEMSS